MKRGEYLLSVCLSHALKHNRWGPSKWEGEKTHKQFL
jgi:hypothetical protein